MKIAEAGYFEMLEPTYQTTLPHIPEDSNFHTYTWSMKYYL
jgi:hypothetical protein